MMLSELDIIGREEYNKGYETGFEDGQKAMLERINTPKFPVAAKYDPAYCPTCKKDFAEYQECDDGIYSIPYSLVRCPHCGQKLNWDFHDLIIL